MTDADEAKRLNRAMLDVGFHKQFPDKRKARVDAFLGRGYCLADFNLLVAQAKMIGNSNHLGLLDKWLSDEEAAGLSELVKDLREESRDREVNTVRVSQLKHSDKARRISALEYIRAAVESDNRPLGESVRLFNTEFQLELLDPITEDEAKRHLFNYALEQGYRSRLEDGPNPHAKEAIQRMVDRAKAEAAESREAPN